MRSRNVLRISLISLFFLFTSAGCMNYPLPVKEPSQKVAYIDSTGIKHFLDTLPDKLDGGLDPALDYQGLMRNLELYEDSYRNTAINFKRQSYGSGDATALGAVVGVLGGLFDKSGAIYGGAGLAAGSSIYSQRYQFEVQSVNYFRASKVMLCLRTRVNSASALSSNQVSEVNLIINKARAKLFDAQWDVKLAAPDVDALKAALARTRQSETQTLDKQQKVDQARATERSLKGAATSNAMQRAQVSGRATAQQIKLMEAYDRAVAVVEFSQRQLAEASFDELKAKLEECVESF
jgi:hypothetical protein